LLQNVIALWGSVIFSFRWFGDWQEVMGNFGHIPRSWQQISQMVLSSKLLHILPTSCLGGRGGPSALTSSCHCLHCGDLADQSLTTSGTQLP
jgi:hypothetical protein